MDIRVDDLKGAATRALVISHLASMNDLSPQESVHALDLNGLQREEVTVWSAWIDGRPAGVVALAVVPGMPAEIKSMKVADDFLGRGVGRALLRHVLTEAANRGLGSLWLETGSSDDFIAARSLYLSEGFTECGPFGTYQPDPLSTFMTRAVPAAD
jgi:putative acetyltransferase